MTREYDTTDILSIACQQSYFSAKYRCPYDIYPKIEISPMITSFNATPYAMKIPSG